MATPQQQPNQMPKPRRSRPEAPGPRPEQPMVDPMKPQPRTSAPQPPMTQPDYSDVPPPPAVAKSQPGAQNLTSGEGDEARLQAFHSANAQNDENEGEGSRTAARRYNDGVEAHLKQNDVEKEARDAMKALDAKDEADELRRAEEAGKKGPRK